MSEQEKLPVPDPQVADTSESREPEPWQRYVLITPARNEESHITRTIQSITSQSILPMKWVIVDDGSKDRTSEIVSHFAGRHPFITHLRVDGLPYRSFSSKVKAFLFGLSHLDRIDYQFIGNLDADIRIGRQYYEKALMAFREDPLLGIVGGVVCVSGRNGLTTTDTALDSVAGAIQLFRRACYEDIGGYVPIETGGIDAAAEVSARMRGWVVRKLPANVAVHEGPIGMSEMNVIRAKIREGRKFRALGYHPLFLLCRCLIRLGEPPMIVGSFFSLLGYVIAWISRQSIVLPPDVTSFLRNEQLEKLKACIRTRRIAVHKMSI